MSVNDIGMSSGASPVNEADVRAEFDNMDFSGLEEIISFYTKTNGGIPAKNTLRGPYNESVRYFLPVKRRFIDSLETIKEAHNFYRSKYPEEKFFDNKIPFAIDDGDNVYCVDVINGKIYFVPMDSEYGLEESKKFISENFGEFLEKLDYYEKVFE